MQFYKPISQITAKDIRSCGPKAVSLAKLNNSGFTVPDGICITSHAYEHFIKETGVDKYIAKELNRKDIASMRWEEIWDTYIRIRSSFIKTDFSANLQDIIKNAIIKHIGSDYTAVRSSSPEEDSSKTSFAGLHDSYVMVKGSDNILKHIKLVWSSLFSTSSLIYRKDNPQWINTASMAVLIQKLVQSKKSGVIFTVNPVNPQTGMIESVWGYNKGLVDGTIEPFSWVINRKTRELVNYTKPKEHLMLDDPVNNKVKKVKHSLPPLDKRNVVRLFKNAMDIEKIFHTSQDIEWTRDEKNMFFLQARPITTIKNNKLNTVIEKDKQLRPDIAKLYRMEKTINHTILPGMKKDIQSTEQLKLSEMKEHELLNTAQSLFVRYTKWKKAYWDYLIPFAHAFRIFGEIYNQRMQPQDPHEYIKLLNSDDMISVKRNKEL